MRFLFSFFSIGILFVAVLFATAPAGTAHEGEEHTAVSFSDSALLREDKDERVFYVENGIKRWIDSAETFRIHGFHWEDIRVVPSGSLSQYAAGEVIRTGTNLILANEREVIPDLIPFPIYDFRFAERRGRTILKFSSTYWNAGNGPLIITSEQNTAHTHHYASDTEHEQAMGHLHEEEVDEGQHSQQIVRVDGTERHKVVGGFHWHSEHSHYHYDDFAHYIFEPVSAGVSAPTRIEKSTRCLWDTLAVDLSLPNAPQKGVFRSCKDAIRQGVSVGWGDVYDFTLADQYLDVHDTPPGIYRFALVVDPFQKLIELRRDNNVSNVVIELDVARRHVKVLASAAPFESSYNTFADGTLIQGDEDTKVYVMNNNKKRWVRNEDIFHSYNFQWGNIRIFPQTTVNMLPFNNIVRDETGTIYALNDYGYKRPLSSGDILTSYSLGTRDIIDINAVELSYYPKARFIQQAGMSTVYILEGASARPLLYVESFDPEAVHIINERDFSRYIQKI